jgi:tetratricopeptide (TPR) repeat protein
MPKFGIISVLLLVVLLSVNAGGQSPDEQEITALVNQAVNLQKTGRLQEALPLAQQALEKGARLWGSESKHTAGLQTILGNLYRSLGNYEQALPLYQQSLQIREKILGPEHFETAISLNNLALLYKTTGSYNQALPLYQRSWKIMEKVLGPDHPGTAISLNNLASLYKTLGNYEQALPLYQQSLRIREKVGGPEHPDTAQSLNNLADLYQARGAYEQALPLYQRSLQIREKVLGPEHPDTEASLNNLGGLYQALGRYDQALPLYQRSLQICEKVLGPEHPDTSISLNNLAGLYQARGSYDLALPLYQRSLRIKEKALGPEHPANAGILRNLAGLYQTMGLYNPALPLLQRSLRITETALGPKHPDTAQSLNNLAGLYQELGSYDQALPLYQRSRAIIDQVWGSENLFYATAAHNLALLYKVMGAYDQALPLYQRSLQIMEKVLGPEHPDVAAALNNLAGLYQAMGNYDQALPLYRRSWQIKEKALGSEHSEVARSLNNLASLYQDLGSYGRALPLYQQALNINEKVLGATHPVTKAALDNTAYIYLDLRDYVQAEKFFQRSQTRVGLIDLALARQQPLEALKYLTGIEPTWKSPPIYRIQYFTQLGLARAEQGQRGEAATALLQAVQQVEELRQKVGGERRGFFQSGIYGGYMRPYRGLVAACAEMSRQQEGLPGSMAKYGPGADEAAFYFAEATKARALLEDLAAAARPHQALGLPAELRRQEQALQNQWGVLDKQWEKAWAGGQAAVQEVQARRDQLRVQLEELIQELRRHYPRYAALHYPLPLPARELPLQENEVLLEYALGDKAGYVFVLRKGGIKKLCPIPLGREDLESRVKDFMEPMQAVELGKFSPAQAHELYKLLLAPAFPEIKENDRIIMVPEGILGLLPFEALVMEPGTGDQDRVYVGDKFTLTYYQSATVMAWQRQLRAEKVNKTLFALGNPIYNPADPRYTAINTLPPASPRAQHPAQTAWRGLATRPDEGDAGKDEARGATIDYYPLPETAEEVKAIAGLWGVKAAPPDILLDLKANETTLRQSPLQDYRYLHFATHADLAGKIQGINEPFILLGQVENAAQDNGFLTLSKVLGLELHADLVVLSACMTGRGQVMAGEGVANFPRSFQYAGAKSVLVSLWPLASHEAVEYMTTFYQHLKSGKNRAEALSLARRAIKAKYPHPFYWAVFILNGEGY